MRGTAPAASPWVMGAVGLGNYDIAMVISLFTVLTLWELSPLKAEGSRGEKDGEEPPQR